MDRIPFGGMTMSIMLAATVLCGGAVGAQTMLGFRLLDLDGAGVRWSKGGATTVVTYAVVTEPAAFAGARNCGGLEPIDGLLEQSTIERAAFMAELRAAFDLWETALDITFRPTEDAATAGIVIGAQSVPTGRAFANVTYRPGNDRIRSIERALICLNPRQTWKIGFGGSLDVYDLRYTFAHEIGHAIGLDHPDGAGQLMSFSYRERFRELQPGDIDGGARLYGRRDRSIEAAKDAVQPPRHAATPPIASPSLPAALSLP